MEQLFLKCSYKLLSLPNRLLNKIDRMLLMKRFRSVGKNFICHYPGSYFGAEKICIGEDVYIGEWAFFGGPITIGNRVMFGPRPTLTAGNHIFAVQGKSPRFIVPEFPDQNAAPIVIEDEVWIGANVTILGNVKIGIGAVIGAGSVVTKEVCPFVVAVGNPCLPVRLIFADQQLFDHMIAIGYCESYAKDVVDYRKRALYGQALPVVDKTSLFSPDN